MFQFTREFIINDNVGKLGATHDKKFVVTAKDGKSVGTDVMFIDNMINLRKEDINAAYKHVFEPEVKEKVELDLTGATIVATDVVRLVITLGKIGQTTATFNDIYPDHSRHLFYEETGKTAVTDVIDALLASVEHEKTISKEVFAKISRNGSKLVIEAPDCYTVVKEVRIVKLPVADADSKMGALLTGYDDWDPILVWTRKEGTTAKVTFTAAKEGNGNTVQILKNMRLQTAANTNPYGLNMDERPIPKGQYDQYLVELVTERRHIGHDVVGSVGTSLTSHVFYVLKGTVSDAFAAELGKLCTVKTATDAKAPKQVLAHTNQLPEEEAASTGA